MATTSSSLSTTTAESNASVSNPYFLHPSDNPGALITPVILKGDNYSEWATEFWNSVQAKQKIGFLDGSTIKPLTNPELARWTAANSMIVGWIRTSIDPPVRSTVSHVPDAFLLWESLKSRFSVKNSVRKHLLEDEITNCKQNGDSVLTYYGRLSKLWEEIQSFKSSHNCTCEASSHIEKEREDAKVHKFLFGLDESRFSSIRSQIIDEDPLPDLNVVYSRVIRAEQHLLTMRATEQKQDVVGFSVKADSPSANSISSTTSPTATRSRDPNRYCTHCNRKGHEASECFLLHGYPEWFVEQGRNSTQSQRGRGGRNNTSAGRGRGRSNATRNALSTFSGNTVASSDQISALINLLQNQQSQLSTERMSGNPSLTDVIIDTGASHHMTGDISLLRDVHETLPSMVKFPDGRTSKSTLSGTLSLNSHCSLLEVLYVPDFDCTLISVSKLLKQTGCIAIFTDTLCFLQDRFSRTLIGAGEEREGVYYFTGVTVARAHRTGAEKSSSSVLWHRLST